jgi:catechol 2,3-dioxygenase-like lactoylglutathione lyase family enzyme
MNEQLLSGINHVATVTRDMDRLLRFYDEVFGAAPEFDLVAPGLNLRHVGINLGGALLHAWEAPETQTGPFPKEMFKRGRLDHLAVAAVDEDALEILRARLVAAGACEGDVTDFGSILSVWFTDPDGMEMEVCCFKAGVAIGDVRDPVPARGSAEA